MHKWIYGRKTVRGTDRQVLGIGNSLRGLRLFFTMNGSTTQLTLQVNSPDQGIVFKWDGLEPSQNHDRWLWKRQEIRLSSITELLRSMSRECLRIKSSESSDEDDIERYDNCDARIVMLDLVRGLRPILKTKTVIVESPAYDIEWADKLSALAMDMTDACELLLDNRDDFSPELIFREETTEFPISRWDLIKSPAYSELPWAIQGRTLVPSIREERDWL